MNDTPPLRFDDGPIDASTIRSRCARTLPVLVWTLIATACVSCTRFGPNPSSAVVLVASDRQKLAVDRPLELLLGVERGAGLTFRRCQLSLPDVQHPGGKYPGMLLRAGRDRIKLVPEPDMPAQEFEESLMSSAPASQPGAPETVQEVLVFVHGYATEPHEAIIEAAQLVHDVHFDWPLVVFTWPTRGLYLSYFVDGINAEWSVPDFVHLLELIHSLPGTQRIHIVGHSMGARIVVRGIKEFLARRCVPPDEAAGIPDLPAPPDGKWFGQIVLVAPDEDTEVFERSFAPILARAAARTTIYFSTRDRALGLAYTIFGYKRLGMGDCPQISPAMLAQVESVDATRVDRGFFGHYYFIDSPEVLLDVQRVLAGESATDPQRRLERKYYYQLLAGTPGPDAAPVP
jgi:esterase/lipase superfamily enzyme